MIPQRVRDWQAVTLNILVLTVVANLVEFVLGVDGGQYFAYALVSNWAGMSSLAPLIEMCLCMLVRRLTAHVGVQERHAVVRWSLSYRRLRTTQRDTALMLAHANGVSL